MKFLNNYSLVHAISPEIATSYMLFRKPSKKPLITTMHGSHRAALRTFIQSPIKNWTSSDFAFHVLEFPLHEIITSRCLANSNRVVICSFTTLNELQTYEGIDMSKVSVIYNGVNLSEIQQQEAEIRKEKTDNDHELSIMYAGRLFWTKGVTFLLRAYENLKMQYKNTRLKIFGKGPLENEVKRFVASKGLKNDVYFGGFLPHKELIKEIMRSDLIVFPSLYESQPMFILEAMACKKPVVVFDAQYAREIISNMQNGLLAKSFDVEDLYGKIALLLSDKYLRRKLGGNGYNYVKQKHNWDIQVEKYIEVYQRAIRMD